MKEQIEEMALDLCDKKTKVAIVIVSIDDEGKPRLARSAHYLKNLVEAGYRKQKEGEWIDQYRGMYANQLYKCSVCGETAFHDDKRWFLTKFCPNCGAHMKGGAE